MIAKKVWNQTEINPVQKFKKKANLTPTQLKTFQERERSMRE